MEIVYWIIIVGLAITVMVTSSGRNRWKAIYRGGMMKTMENALQAAGISDALGKLTGQAVASAQPTGSWSGNVLYTSKKYGFTPQDQNVRAQSWISIEWITGTDTGCGTRFFYQQWRLTVTVVPNAAYTGKDTVKRWSHEEVLENFDELVPSLEGLLEMARQHGAEYAVPATA